MNFCSRPLYVSFPVAAFALAACQTSPPGTEFAAAQREEVVRQVPYQGAFGPSDPPAAPIPPTQKPVQPWVQSALDVWYERPSPKGPAPIAHATPKAIYVEGRDPVIQALPGPPAFPDRIPKHLQVAHPEKVPYSNNVKRLRGGKIRLAAIDRTLNDTKLSNDWMAVEASFTDHEGAEWRIEQVMLAPISSNPVAEPWLGGVGMDVPYHGQTGNGTPAVPLVKCAMCSWGWADVYKNGKRVASSALLHLMVTSDTRNDRDGFKYYGYDSTKRPVREIHLLVPPSAHLPSPGGFLHVMWEDAEITHGSPEQIKARAAGFEQNIPTIELSAVPYLKWDRKEIHVKTGQKYRLVVHNNDPSSFHQFNLHARPESGGHATKSLRHEEGMTAGRTGALWKPGEDHQGSGGGDPPAPRNVFLTLPQGATWATMVEFDKSGEYPFMCPVSNHYRRGMEGKFIVSADGKGGRK